MAGLVAILRASGAGASRQDAVEQPFFSVPGTFVAVHGEGIQVFEYPDGKTADSEAGRVSADGMTVGTTKPHWTVPPHFYRSGRLIVLYLGSTPKVLGTLRDALGEPFAGSR